MTAPSGDQELPSGNQELPSGNQKQPSGDQKQPSPEGRTTLNIAGKESPRGSRSGPEEQRLQGHWLLAKMGKKVLRPGGLELTRKVLEQAHPSTDDLIVEFGPGVGKTAEMLLAVEPKQYWGVDIREGEGNPLSDVLAGHQNAVLVNADARNTGLPDGCATLVVGEAMLTMQPDSQKLAIMKEAFRVLKPGGRYAIHEMGFRPDTPEEASKAVEKGLSRTIKVGARPLTADRWVALLEEAGFTVQFSTTNKMALLEVRRMIDDEGVRGVLRFVSNVAKNPAARKRILKMRKTFQDNQRHLCAVGFVASKGPGVDRG